MAYCNKCGSFIPDGAKFCENCGTPVAVEKAETDYNQFNDSYAQQGSFHEAPQTDYQQQNYYQQPYQQSFQRPK